MPKYNDFESFFVSIPYSDLLPNNSSIPAQKVDTIGIPKIKASETTVLNPSEREETNEELAENQIVREKYLSNSFVLRRKEFMV